MNAFNFSIKTERTADGFGWKKTAYSPIARSELFSRTPFSPSVLQRLKDSTVVIFGTGSGGGKLAVDIAKAGVGHIRLVDPAILQADNILRHVASHVDIGRYKVEAVGDVVLGYNPDVIVEAYPYDCFKPESRVKPENLFREVDLAIGATDSTETQLQINAFAWQMKVPAVFGGCYEAALGGEVLFTLPGESTSCLSCLRGGLKPPEVKGPFDYSTARYVEDFRGEPGLNAAVDFITAVEAQIALGIFLRDTDALIGKLIYPQYNFLLVGGALGTGFYRFRRPFHIFWQPLKGPRPGCEICQEGMRQQQEDVPEVGHEIPAEFRDMLGGKEVEG